MQLSSHSSFGRNLRLFIALATMEMLAMGVFLLRARSLNTSDTILGYSLPRLILLAIWLIGFAICLWASISVLKKDASFQWICTGAKKLVENETHYTGVFSHLIVIVILCWGTGLSIMFQPEFVAFIGSNPLISF